MKPTPTVFAALIASGLLQSAAAAQVTPVTQPPTTAAAEVTACAQAQMVVDSLLTNANARLELARQSNSAADLRAAVDALQTTIRDVRAQLAACANVGAADPHAGHAMPAKTTPPPPALPAPPTADPHAGHTVAPSKPAPSTTKPATAKPAAPDPHAEHAAPATPQSKDGKAVDPVCGLRVDPASAPSTKHAGQTYYFCSNQHRDLFVKSPAKFLPGKK